MKQAVWLSLSVLFALSGFSQTTEENDEAGIYSNVSAGFGMNYGGFGLNAEIGYKHITMFISGGYATERKLEMHTIPSSVNFNGGMRYYFKIKSAGVYPRVGANLGWITNYYSDKIGSAVYNPNASGLAIHTGAQIYSHSGVIFSFDAVMSSRYLLFNQPTHPHFYYFYIRPSIGVGIDLNTVFKKDKPKTIKNEEVNPLG